VTGRRVCSATDGVNRRDGPSAASSSNFASTIITLDLEKLSGVRGHRGFRGAGREDLLRADANINRSFNAQLAAFIYA
jgi:hypothetical protein